MNKIILSCLLLASFCPGNVLAQESKAPAKTEVVTAEVGKAVETFDKFDPQSYTCAKFEKDLPTASENAGVALIWAHGYQSAVFGTDEMGALDEKTIGELAQEYSEYCSKHPTETFSRASKALTKEEE